MKRQAKQPLTITGISCCEIEFGTPEFDEALALRDRILRQPLHLTFSSEQIASEWDSLHLGLYDGSGRLLGCLIMKPINKGLWKMRQVAVDESFQGRGLGQILVRYAESKMIQRGCKKIELHARDTAVPFYIRMDYKLIGEPFDEVGIPHRAMYKHIYNEKD